MHTIPPPTPEETRTKGVVPELTPLERWEISQPGNVLRVFERGGEKKGEIGNPKPRRRCRQARRQARRARLRHAAAHRSGLSRPAEDAPARSAAFVSRHERSAGRLSRQRLHGVPRGLRQRSLARAFRPVRALRQSGRERVDRSDDPARTSPGHPIRHTFTRSIPSSQCMVCHVHPGTNMETTYFGYTWWDNEADGDVDVSRQQQRNPTEDERYRGCAAQSRRRGGARAVVGSEISGADWAARNSTRKLKQTPVRRFSQPRLALPRRLQARSTGQSARRR